jgi:hypothetical protein
MALTVVVFVDFMLEEYDVAIDYTQMIGSDPRLHYGPRMIPHAIYHGLDTYSNVL